MKKIVLLFSFALISCLCYAQEVGFDVSGIYPKSIVKERLINAETLQDINPGYPTSWVTGYISVDVTVAKDGTIRKENGKNHVLSQKQKDLLQSAELNAEISVDVIYNPKGLLGTSEDIKTVNFSYKLVPTIEATYPQGDEALREYLKEKTLEKLSEADANKIELASIQFDINELGQVVNAKMIKHSKQTDVDQLLLDVITNMPRWTPAENMYGKKVKQTFQFSFGTQVGC